MILAASYLRMSKEIQDQSLPAQRVAIAALAKSRGYKIVHEYVDSGISGDATEKRVQFQQMLADAARGDFKAILCWDMDRFGRFDSLEAGFWILPLRNAGVQLVTVAQGAIDWNDFTGRIMYTIQQEAKHAFLRDLSRNINRGKMEAAKSGRWMGGAAPYGYRLGANQRLEVHPEHGRIVAQIFKWYASGESMRKICISLAEQGTPSPNGGNWWSTQISKIVQNRLYLGHTQYNKRSRGKYTRIVNGEIVPLTTVAPAWNDESLWMVIPNTHPPLTTQAAFDAAQKHLQTNKRFSGPPSLERVLFRGMLRCGWCGHTMMGFYIPRLSDTCYVCQSHNTSGQCVPNRVYQKPLLEWLKDRLEKHHLSNKVIAAVKKTALANLEHPLPEVSSAALQKSLDAARKRLAKAEPRLLTVPDDMVSIVSGQIRELRAEVATLEQQIRAASIPKKDARQFVDQWIEESISSYRAVVAGIENGTPTEIANLIQSAFDRIVTWSEKETGIYQSNGRIQPNGKWKLVRGEIHGKSPEISR